MRLVMGLAAALAVAMSGGTVYAKMVMQTFPVLAGAGAHDVYPAADGTVWFTAQSAGKLGHLDPRSGKSDLIALGPGAAPHGVIVGPDGAAWVTEGGQNAIVRSRPRDTRDETLPASQGAAQRKSEHGGFRSPGRDLVHGAERHLRAARSQVGHDGGLRCAPRSRPLRDCKYARWPGVLRLACRQLPRSDRSRGWRGHCPGASGAAPRRTPRLERQPRRAVDHRLE